MHIRTWDGDGAARLHPHEPAVPEIGAEIAAARALSALGTALLDAALEDIRGALPVT